MRRISSIQNQHDASLMQLWHNNIFFWIDPEFLVWWNEALKFCCDKSNKNLASFIIVTFWSWGSLWISSLFWIYRISFLPFPGGLTFLIGFLVILLTNIRWEYFHSPSRAVSKEISASSLASLSRTITKYKNILLFLVQLYACTN